jgi:hypothetical protein
MFTKSERYYANGDAVREPLQFNPWSLSNKHGSRGKDAKTRHGAPGQNPHSLQREGHSGYFRGDGSPAFNPAGRNRRDVWTIPTQPFKEKHFAVFSEKLVEPMVLAACPQRVCKRCHEPEVAVIDDSVLDMGKESADKTADCVAASETSALRYKNKVVERTIVGYRPLCKCGVGFEPGILLDPFAGAGTTCAVAKRLGRHYLGIELNPEYVKMAEKRIRAVRGLCSPLFLIHGFYAFLRRIWVKHWSAMTSPYVSCTILLSTSSCRLIEQMCPGFDDIARPINTRAGWIYSGNEVDLSGEPT